MLLTTFIEILGTFAFALSGALAAMERKLDPFGVMIIAFVTAIGGGTIRDILVGDLPVRWLTDSRSMIIIFIAIAISLLVAKRIGRFQKLLLIFDAAGLGLFTLLGIQRGIFHGFPPAVCIALGVITGCFGGVIRDVLLNTVPLIFKKEIYATACLVGGTVYFLLKNSVGESVASSAAIVLIVVIRMLAVRYNWSLPKVY